MSVSSAAAALPAPAHRPWRMLWLRFARYRAAQVGLAVTALLIAAAVVGPWLMRHDPLAVNPVKRLLPPSREHVLGTDELGRDLLTRLVYGARISLRLGFISVGIALLLGLPAGLASGYYRGWVDLFFMRAVEVIQCLPPLLLAIVVVSVIGTGLVNAMIAVGISQAPTFARLIRGQVLVVREMDYVEAARAVGARDALLMRRHILPNCLAPLIVQATLQVATALLTAASLGFLGLGAQPPDPEWGAMLSRARQFLRTAPMVATYPGLAILVTVLGLNLVGDGLRDALDPRLKR
ncbi:MAG: ABC transporter permease [Armatimonadetes bacterium]|nr:ABC transporter permease [Armatimonadota bacterium]